MESAEGSLRALAEAHNENAEAFRSCLYALEARQWIIMKAMDEFVGKGNPNITVDWAAYEEQYCAFVEKERAAQELAKNPVEDPEAGAVVFGGK